MAQPTIAYKFQVEIYSLQLSIQPEQVYGQLVRHP